MSGAILGFERSDRMCADAHLGLTIYTIRVLLTDVLNLDFS